MRVTDAEILAAIANIPDEASQIDTIMSMRRCFGPNEDDEFYLIVQDYLTNNLDVNDTTRKLVSPSTPPSKQTKKNPAPTPSGIPSSTPPNASPSATPLASSNSSPS
ncbi:hypothetical protein P3342_010086 [Pyrenophora teres f. teres]|nr:hypothetical protein P3342_010086 [Pyrenophora teres f. teres]